MTEIANVTILKSFIIQLIYIIKINIYLIMDAFQYNLLY